ncbi:hypothetical protein [Streptomyces ipomoeae]|uniref:hypothetical protein n=1 Tax=Streptomyces ipomoeae TaxID=103232 RepID=UPI0029BEAE8A|nr:hypothetical protein [Streptomyces ipomoeae]MDX2692195.1 hypothetical protein [Streptomyces ipomoeae]MDX2839302.1 hypothetical protein [Streptomyces ipomoeae]
MRRLAALLLALVATLSVLAGPASADDIPGQIVDGACEVVTHGSIGGALIGAAGDALSGGDLCDKVGDKVDEKIDEHWQAVKDSVLGDVVETAADVVRWVIKKVLTVALLGPSVDLEGTGLWSGKATLAGMLVWLGLVIAAFGMIWQLGKMAVTGQVRHAGRALLGFGENMLLSAVGVGLFAVLLSAGDALTAGLVNATFDDDGTAYETIVAVLVPKGIGNPITMLCVVAVLLLIGFIQLILVFLRQSAIPIICLLLPVAGAGRAGGDATRKWAPRLITSGLVIVTYKPILAVIICTGFAEFGHSKTLAEWLRGCATLVLAILAPGPLTKIFAPFGEAVGGGMASGGMSGAFAGAAGYLANKGSQEAGGGGGADGPTDAVKHAQYVERERSRQGGEGDEGRPGADAQAQAQRNEANARVPAQSGNGTAATAGTGTAATTGATTGQATAAAGTAGTASTAAAGPVGIGIQVLDGVNDTVQGASNTIGNGGNS